jgi:AraC-like DNA-binding protein
VDGWKREVVPGDLERNRQRREKATAERDAAKQELQEILVRGQAVGFDVARMARHAGISRDTAYRLLREAGSLSHTQIHHMADEAGNLEGRPEPIGSGNKG